MFVDKIMESIPMNKNVILIPVDKIVDSISVDKNLVPIPVAPVEGW